jgi:hypothetical protein
MVSGKEYTFNVSATGLSFQFNGYDGRVWKTTREWDTPPDTLCVGQTASIQVRGTDGANFQSRAYISIGPQITQLDQWAGQKFSSWNDALGGFLFRNYPLLSNPDTSVWSKPTTLNTALPAITYQLSLPDLPLGTTVFHVGVSSNDGGDEEAVAYWPYVRQ